MKTKIDCPSCQQPIEINIGRSRLLLTLLTVICIGSIVVAAIQTGRLRSQRARSWSEMLQYYSLAVNADRADLLSEIQNHWLLTDSERYIWLTNCLGTTIMEPVHLHGRVYGHGPHDVSVISLDGSPGAQWPNRMDGRLVQGGVFELRDLAGNSEYTPATIIQGLGFDPLPIILTNDAGERILKMTYRFQRD